MSRFAALLGLIAAAGSSGCGGNASPPPIVLGHVAPLSGADGRAGKQAERGIQLALEDLGTQASEKLAGRPIVVRHVDAGTLDALEAAAARLVTVNKAAALLGGMSGEQALRFDRVHAPVVAAAGMRSTAMSESLFTTGLSPTRQGDVLGRHLAGDAAGRVVLIVDTRRDQSQALAEAFKKGWAEAASQSKSPPQLGETGFGQDARFDEIAARTFKTKPDTLVFAGEPGDFLSFKREAKAEKLQWVYAGSDGSLDASALAAGESMLVATAFALDKEGKTQEFAKRYRDRFHDEPTVHAAVAYDNARLLVEAIQNAGVPPTAEKIRDELRKIKDFAGLTGPLSFDGGQHLRRPAFIARLTPGAPPAAVKAIAAP